MGSMLGLNIEVNGIMGDYFRHLEAARRADNVLSDAENALHLCFDDEELGHRWGEGGICVACRLQYAVLAGNVEAYWDLRAERLRRAECALLDAAKALQATALRKKYEDHPQ